MLLQIIDHIFFFTVWVLFWSGTDQIAFQTVAFWEMGNTGKYPSIHLSYMNIFEFQFILKFYFLYTFKFKLQF